VPFPYRVHQSLRASHNRCIYTWQNLVPRYRKLSNTTCLDEDDTSDGVEKRTISILAATPVSWHALLEQVPLGFMELSFKLLFHETICIGPVLFKWNEFSILVQFHILWDNSLSSFSNVVKLTMTICSFPGYH